MLIDAAGCVLALVGAETCGSPLGPAAKMVNLELSRKLVVMD